MASDRTCKYLVEQYPAAFVRWLLSTEPVDIQVLKTELSLEPIRADSLTLLQTANRNLCFTELDSPINCDGAAGLRHRDFA